MIHHPKIPNYYGKVSHDIKQRVRLAGPNGSRCLITNSGHSVEYCYCIPKRALMLDDDVCLFSCTYLFWFQILVHNSSIALNGAGKCNITL
jgi:hypothetical protein